MIDHICRIRRGIAAIMSAGVKEDNLFLKTILSDAIKHVATTVSGDRETQIALGTSRKRCM